MMGQRGGRGLNTLANLLKNSDMTAPSPSPPAARGASPGTVALRTGARRTPPGVDGPGGPQPLRVGFVLLDAFTLAAFSGLMDVLRLAADHGGRSRQIHARWEVMSVGGQPRTSSSGQTLSGLRPLGAPQDFDYLAVCGGNDYLNARQPPELLAWLRDASAQGRRFLGICTGTFVLAQAGLIGPRSVCVHWNVVDVFRARFPDIRAEVDRLFIDEGDLITCAGSTAAIDLGLYLVGRHCGPHRAQQAMRHMMLQGMRPGRSPQPHFHANLSGIHDVRVRRAAHFMEQRLTDPPSLDSLARYVGISARQLERAFRAQLGLSPMAFFRHLRLEYARSLLLGRSRSITQIALDCGFADGAHFCREFGARFGVTPRSYLKLHADPAGRAGAAAA